MLTRLIHTTILWGKYNYYPRSKLSLDSLALHHCTIRPLPTMLSTWNLWIHEENAQLKWREQAKQSEEMDFIDKALMQKKGKHSNNSYSQWDSREYWISVKAIYFKMKEFTVCQKGWLIKKALIHVSPEILKNNLYFQRRNVNQIGFIFFIQNTNW